MCVFSDIILKSSNVSFSLPHHISFLINLRTSIFLLDFVNKKRHPYIIFFGKYTFSMHVAWHIYVCVRVCVRMRTHNSIRYYLTVYLIFNRGWSKSLIVLLNITLIFSFHVYFFFCEQRQLSIIWGDTYLLIYIGPDQIRTLWIKYYEILLLWMELSIFLCQEIFSIYKPIHTLKDWISRSGSGTFPWNHYLCKKYLNDNLLIINLNLKSFFLKELFSIAPPIPNIQNSYLYSSTNGFWFELFWVDYKWKSL